MKKIILLCLLCISYSVYSQKKTDASSGATYNKPKSEDYTNDLFDNSPMVKLKTSRVKITGEVEQEMTIDCESLPKYIVIIKELPYSDNKEGKSFIGSYKYVGASLIDILNSARILKKNKENFEPYTDLYVEIENKKGEKAVLSWGEIFYSTDPNKIIIATNVAPILPSETDDQWELPKKAKLVVGFDYQSVRNIDDPTKITIKSYDKEFPGIKHLKPLYSESFKIYKEDQFVKEVKVIDENLDQTSYYSAFFGGHKGYKGNRNFKGILFYEAFRDLVPASLENIRNGLVVIGARDAYRCVFSVSEIFNRNDLRDLLLLDYGKDNEDGRFLIHPSIDFFADRTIKAISIIYISVHK